MRDIVGNTVEESQLEAKKKDNAEEEEKRVLRWIWMVRRSCGTASAVSCVCGNVWMMPCVCIYGWQHACMCLFIYYILHLSTV